MKSKLQAQTVPAASSSALTPEQTRAEELTASVKAELATLKQAFWRIGHALHEIRRRELFRSLGYDSFVAYVSARLHVERDQAYKTMRVASFYFQDDAQKLTLECAAALIPYAKLLKTDPGILVRDNALIGDRPVVEASARDIRHAAAELRAEIGRRKSRAPAAREREHAEKAVHDGLHAVMKDAGMPRPHSIHFDKRSGDVVVRMRPGPLFELFAD